MAKTLLNVKTDVEVKKKAQEIAKQMGIPLSTIVNAYLADFINKKKVTFSVESELRPEVGARLLQQSKEAREGKNIIGPFKTAEEMDAYLDA